MRWEAEGSGEGEELAVMRNQSRECSEGGVSALEDEGTLVVQDNTMCAGEQMSNPWRTGQNWKDTVFPSCKTWSSPRSGGSAVSAEGRIHADVKKRLGTKSSWLLGIKQALKYFPEDHGSMERL